MVGAGLVGGSLIRALAARGVEVEVFDLDVATRSAVAAWARDAAPSVTVHEGLSSACLGVELVVLAAPAAALPALARQLVNLTPTTAVVTDVCSVKGGVVPALEEILVPAGISYVGGHPMAGREISGFGASLEGLFSGCAWVLTETPATIGAHLSRLARLALDLGADRVVLADPHAHDDAVGAVSHLPHFLATIGALCALEVDDRLPDALSLAGGGFRDTTRVAAGSPLLWTGIALENAEVLAEHLGAAITSLEALRTALMAGDAAAVHELLARGAAGRERWAGHQQP